MGIIEFFAEEVYIVEKKTVAFHVASTVPQILQMKVSDFVWYWISKL